MKELYKPVFWCGFALSLSALYASSERVTADEESAIRKPVLMQINIGQAINETVDSNVIERNQMIAGSPILTAPEVSEDPVPIEVDVQPSEPQTPETSTQGTSVFFSAAQEVLGRN